MRARIRQLILGYWQPCIITCLWSRELSTNCHRLHCRILMTDKLIDADANVPKGDLKIRFKVQGVMISEFVWYYVCQLFRQATVWGSLPSMLRVRKRSVNCLYLPISWSGPCRPVFLGPVGGESGETESWDHVEGDLPKSGRGPLGSRHLFVEAARPDTPLVFLRLLFAGGSSSGPLRSQKAIGLEKRKARVARTDRAPRSWHCRSAAASRRATILRPPRSLLALIGFYFSSFLRDTLVTF